MRWKEAFKTTHPGEVYAHTYGKNMLRDLLNTKGLASVYIFNALDGEGNLKIVFKGADESGRLIENGIAYNSGVTCPPICPTDGRSMAGIGSRIDESLAQQFILNFQEKCEDRPYAQLYDKNVFETILNYKNVEGVQFSLGVDSSGQERFILAGLDTNGMVVTSDYDTGLPRRPGCPELYPPSFVTQK